VGDGRCSTTVVSSTNGSGMAYDFNNEYRDTNDNTEREKEQHFEGSTIVHDHGASRGVI
jgi:hypothetical protein